MNFGILPENKTLRAKWNIEEDTSGFIIRIDDKPEFQVGFLVALSSVHDALGLGASFLLIGRSIIQGLCKKKKKKKKKMKLEWTNR